MAIEIPYENSLHTTETNDTETYKSVNSQETNQTLLPTYANGSRSNGSSVKFPVRSHNFDSPSGAIQLYLESIGQDEQPMFMQHVFPSIKGHVTATIAGESVTQIRVQAKGTLASVAGQMSTTYDAGAQSGAPFWHQSKVLWSAGDPVSATGVTDEMDFAFRIPEWVEMAITFGQLAKCPTPPSYTLKAAIDKKKSETLASVKFSLKVFIERSGFGHRDEVLKIPFTYSLEQQAPSFIPESRRLSLLKGTPLPGPTSEPEAWKTHSYEKVVTKSGLFTLKDIPIQVNLKLPSPLVCAMGEKLPFFLTMSAPNLSKLGSGTMSLRLIERRWTGSGGLGPGECFETVIANASSQVDTSETNDAQNRAFKGVMPLDNASSPSFKTPKLEVQHTIIVVLVENGMIKEEIGGIPVVLFVLKK